MIDIKDIVTLDDDKKYVVASKTDYSDGKTYYYLVDINDNGNVKFGYLDNEEFVEINNSELISLLLPLFAKNGMEALTQEVLDKLQLKED